MNKPAIGILVGAALGVLDGLTAWFTPEVRPFLAGILVGSCFKGMVIGLLSGLRARKVRSDLVGTAIGAALGLLFAYAVAAMPSATGAHYYLQIMIPGLITGAIIGFLTQRTGTNPGTYTARARD
jgi:hypothetical protein